MSPNRRELLGRLGVASASALLWAAAGCGAAGRATRSAPEASSEGVRGWLRDAVARLVAAFPGAGVHALAVSRQRTAAVRDTLGTGVSRGRRDGVVLTVRDARGAWREHVTSDLSATGVDAAVRALTGGRATARAAVAFPAAPPAPPVVPRLLEDIELHNRLVRITRGDAPLDSRIIYAASLLDVDDAHVWSVSPAHDREQRLVRVRNRVTRATWSGRRPVVAEVERGWLGGIEDDALAPREVQRAAEHALLVTTPGELEDDERVVVLDPTVTAAVIEAASYGLLLGGGRGGSWGSGGGGWGSGGGGWGSGGGGWGSGADGVGSSAPLVLGAAVAAPLVTLVDDPTTAGAYGGYAFDDEGAPAAASTLIDAGRLASVLGGGGRARRPGHVGPLEPSASHLRLEPGTTDAETLRPEVGLLLEGGRLAALDAGGSHVTITAARAWELRGGRLTGRVFPDVELVGEVAQLLANVEGVSADHAIVPLRDDLDGEPRWRSIDAPFLRTRGLLRARRRLA